MNYRVVLFSILCAASALALASLMTIWSTNGSGIVRNAAGRQGFFHVSAAKRVHGSAAAHVGGSFVLEFPSTTANFRGERIFIEVRGYSQDGNVSHIEGPAVWRRMTNTGPQEVHGHGAARFTSNRHPEEAGDPDTLEVHFVSPTAPAAFDFAGAVVRGDVTIAKTESH